MFPSYRYSEGIITFQNNERCKKLFYYWRKWLSACLVSEVYCLTKKDTEVAKFILAWQRPNGNTDFPNFQNHGMFTWYPLHLHICQNGELLLKGRITTIIKLNDWIYFMKLNQWIWSSILHFGNNKRLQVDQCANHHIKGYIKTCIMVKKTIALMGTFQLFVPWLSRYLTWAITGTPSWSIVPHKYRCTTWNLRKKPHHAGGHPVP